MKYYPLLYLIASTLLHPGIKGCGESISINDNIIPIELSAKKKQTQINDVASQLQLQHQLGVRK